MRTLLIGGQACVFYGAAEFSRDLDLLVLADPNSLELLRVAMAFLQAETIAIPELAPHYLDRGHAVHFRCQLDDVRGLRIDVMSKLRGTDDFDALWSRRTTIVARGVEVDLLSLRDLVKAKKTQRDKDWPMIRRLMEQASLLEGPGRDESHLEFLFLELRTPDLLITLAEEYPDVAIRISPERPAVAAAINRSVEDVEAALALEEASERKDDRAYWQPLRQELETLRRSRVRPSGE